MSHPIYGYREAWMPRGTILGMAKNEIRLFTPKADWCIGNIIFDSEEAAMEFLEQASLLFNKMKAEKK